ncbi:unnamed protein product [Meloidogyne enterolobii]|uniref:Uncharacterized protein n=1 Tax=Meloidogyne enterolobii TaxID=390850 RepID=A0ACB1ASH2_MELEN
MQEKCLEIVKSRTPNLDNNKLIEISQKEVNEYSKRCDERNKDRQKIFTSPDNPFNKAIIPFPQFSSLHHPRAHPLTTQLGGVQYALPRVPPPVPHVLAQNFLNYQKKCNPHYAKKPPLPVGIQNQPLLSAQNHQQQTQHDKTTIPFHQQSGQLQAHPQHISGQKQQIQQQQHVVEDNTFHQKSLQNQHQVQHARTNIPYPPIVGHAQQYVGTNNPFSQTYGQIHQQQPQNVETNIPPYPISGQNQKQMHQQHVETNNLSRIEQRKLSLILNVVGVRRFIFWVTPFIEQ